MAPKVCVPADFGRHHIGAPSHGNLTFNLREGVQIKANSIILSLNSPVIDDLTTYLHQTSLDADDFSREAVDCFIEASYTGEVEALNVGNFREVNKMGYVFKVDWLVSKCEQYFLSYLDKLDSESSYTDILFAVEEAVYVLATLKTEDLLYMVARRINLVFSSEMRSIFITEYFVDLGVCSKAKIDTCITIVKQDLVHVLINILLVHLEKQGRKNLDENSRHLLRNVDLTVCLGKYPDVHAQLFTTLENIEHVEKEDYQLFVALHKQTTSKSHSQSPSVELDLFPFSKDFLAYTNFEFVLCKLASNPRVDSLYSFFDGLWCRLFQEDILGGSCEVPQDIAEKIVAIKDEHCWGKMNYNYVNRIAAYISTTDSEQLIDCVRNCNDLVSEADQPRRIVFCDFDTPGNFVEKYFRHNTSKEFKISDAKYADMNFVFSTTAMIGDDPDTFSMNLVLMENRPNKKMKLEQHYTNQHGFHQMPKLHFALEVIAAGDNLSLFLPISWCGKPICDKTKTYWNWGYVTFHKEKCSELDMFLHKDGSVDFNGYFFTNSLTDGLRDMKDGAKSDRVRLVAFLIEY